MMSCAHCGEQWDHHPARQVPCPDCYAAAGVSCKRPSGHEVFGGDVHISREQLAVDKNLLGTCRGKTPQPPAYTLF